MRWLMLFVLVPNLVFAMTLRDHAKIRGKIEKEWRRYVELAQQFDRLGVEEKQHQLGLLHEAIEHCKKAIVHYDYIIGKIGEKSAVHQSAWKDEKNQSVQERNFHNAQLGNLQALISNTHRDVVYRKASSFYQESTKKGGVANGLNQKCPRRLNNVEEVVATLNEMSRVYEDAASLAGEALSLIAGYEDEVSKGVLKQAVEEYVQAAGKCKMEAAQWPAAVVAEKEALMDRLAILRDAVKQFNEEGLKRNAYDLEREQLAIIEQLMEEAGEPLSEEFEKLKKSIALFEAE